MATAYLSPAVYIEEVDKGQKPIESFSTAVAAFVGFAEKGPVGVATLVTNWTQFTQTFGGFFEGSYLAHAVYGYFNNGGSICYVSRLPGEVTTTATRNGKADGRGQLPSASAVLPSRSSGTLPTLELTALEPSSTQDVTVEVRPPDEGAPEEQFTLVIRHAGQEEVFPNLTLARGKGDRNVVQVVNRESRLVRVAEREVAGSLAERAPTVGTYTLARSTTQLAEVSRELALPEIKAATFIGDAAAREGILGYEVMDNVTVLCVPDLMAAYQADRISDEGVRAVQTAMMDHCANMRDRMAVLDCPPRMSPQQMRAWRRDVARYDSKYAALYYPWIKVADPLSGDPILVPPSGHMAGIWARNDSERGVHKAPANEVVRGALGLETEISRNEQDTLNPEGINCIRAFPGRGVRVWGARTLSSDPAWRYLNVRRLFNFVEKSIDTGTQWVVFEPNDFYTWERIKRDVTAFLSRVWRDGALFGATQNQAFYVKCDEELNSDQVRNAGQLIVEVGIAPVKPAEFVIFRISQHSGAPA